MSTMALCPACLRHVRATDPRCPFCDAIVSSAATMAPPAGRPGALSRAALYAVGAALATTVAGCSGSTGSVPPPDASGDAAAETGSDAGGDAVADAGTDAGVDAPPDTFCCPPYGCVFPDQGCDTLRA